MNEYRLQTVYKFITSRFDECTPSDIIDIGNLLISHGLDQLLKTKGIECALEMAEIIRKSAIEKNLVFAREAHKQVMDELAEWKLKQ